MFTYITKDLQGYYESRSQKERTAIYTIALNLRIKLKYFHYNIT